MGLISFDLVLINVEVLIMPYFIEKRSISTVLEEALEESETLLSSFVTKFQKEIILPKLENFIHRFSQYLEIFRKADYSKDSLSTPEEEFNSVSSLALFKYLTDTLNASPIAPKINPLEKITISLDIFKYLERMLISLKNHVTHYELAQQGINGNVFNVRSEAIQRDVDLMLKYWRENNIKIDSPIEQQDSETQNMFTWLENTLHASHIKSIP